MTQEASAKWAFLRQYGPCFDAPRPRLAWRLDLLPLPWRGPPRRHLDAEGGISAWFWDRPGKPVGGAGDSCRSTPTVAAGNTSSLLRTRPRAYAEDAADGHKSRISVTDAR